MPSVSSAVSQALPAIGPDVDLNGLQDELDLVAHEAAAARAAGRAIPDAIRDGAHPAMARFHRDLEDALFVEIPPELEGWVDALGADDTRGRAAVGRFADTLTRAATALGEGELQRALAEFLVFEAVRLRLAVTLWSNQDFERTGGDADEIDDVAWAEVEAMLKHPTLAAGGVRPLQVLFASAFVMLARETNDRVASLQVVAEDVREELAMRARLRAALRELRLPEAILLGNALSNLLGTDRVELGELQADHRLALGEMTRQAMDQRVSRGRKALGGGPQSWPRRRRPALFDRLRAPARPQ